MMVQFKCSQIGCLPSAAHRFGFGKTYRKFPCRCRLFAAKHFVCHSRVLSHVFDSFWIVSSKVSRLLTLIISWVWLLLVLWFVFNSTPPTTPMKDRDYINYRANLPSHKRRLLGPAQQREPWYSINRPRNIIILSVFLTSLMFAKPIADVCYSLKNSFRLYNEQEKFKKQLDQEEAAEFKPWIKD